MELLDPDELVELDELDDDALSDDDELLSDEDEPLSDDELVEVDDDELDEPRASFL